MRYFIFRTALEKTSTCHHKGKYMNSLTCREREIVLALAEGLSNKHVGRRLNLSEGTVKVHLHNIYNKLGVKNRTALAVLAHTEFAWVRTLAHTAASDFERADLEFA
jgi:DNA-binding NarL/FixJ family response regulator